MGVAPFRVLKETTHFLDRRLTDLRYNEYAHQACVPQTLEEWADRRDWVIRRMRTACGLLPEPQRPDLNTTVWDAFEHEGCRISKVRFESRPGFIVTGSLYTSVTQSEPAPAILCPHGHWPKGRLHHDDTGSIPLRCLALAKLGFVVFSYDMIGYNDSGQVQHRWSQELQRHGALYGITPFGLQTWNSIRAIDFLESRSDVDATRIGCTGASGGGSQTWNLALLDERVKVIAPVCMLSCHFQGGCACEEAPLLRLGDLTTFDMLSSIAPRPCFVTSVTDDWTNLNPAYEVPALKAIYALHGAEDCVGGVHFRDKHNYNKRTREHVSAWLVRWLMDQPDTSDRIEEPKLTPPDCQRMRFARNGGSPDAKATRRTLATLCRQETAHFDELPQNKAALNRFRKHYAEIYAEIIGVDPSPPDVAVRVTYTTRQIGNCTFSGRLVSRRGLGDLIPAYEVVPDKISARGTTLVLGAHGKNSLFDEKGVPGPRLARLLAQGQRLMLPDLLGQGDGEWMPERTATLDKIPNGYAFNSSLLALRIQDILTVTALLRQSGNGPISLCAEGINARLALLALPFMGRIASADLCLEGTRDTELDWQGECFHPGILRAGALRTAFALAAPTPIALSKTPSALRNWAQAVYAAIGKPERLRLRTRSS